MYGALFGGGEQRGGGVAGVASEHTEHTEDGDGAGAGGGATPWPPPQSVSEALSAFSAVAQWHSRDE